MRIQINIGSELDSPIKFKSYQDSGENIALGTPSPEGSRTADKIQGLFAGSLEIKNSDLTIINENIKLGKHNSV